MTRSLRLLCLATCASASLLLGACATTGEADTSDSTPATAPAPDAAAPAETSTSASPPTTTTDDSAGGSDSSETATPTTPPPSTP